MKVPKDWLKRQLSFPKAVFPLGVVILFLKYSSSFSIKTICFAMYQVLIVQKWTLLFYRCNNLWFTYFAHWQVLGRCLAENCILSRRKFTIVLRNSWLFHIHIQQKSDFSLKLIKKGSTISYQLNDIIIYKLYASP